MGHQNVSALATQLSSLLTDIGVHPSITTAISALLLTALLVGVSIGVYYLCLKVVGKIILKIAEKTNAKWDDIVFRPQFLKSVWILFSTMAGYSMLHTALGAYPTLLGVATTIFEVAMLVMCTVVVVELVESIFMLLGEKENLDDIARKVVEAEEQGQDFEYQPSHSLKGLQQMIIVLIVGVAIILLISVLFGKNPLYILSGLSAGAAVLMLVFKDSILGVVAGVQLTANKMVQPGDWITAPKYGVNGIVKEITLATVKVQNFDKTIVTMPPYSLITDAFQNWKGMQQSGGRRVMRYISIDMSTIRFCTEEQKAQWSATHWGEDMDWSGDVPNISAYRHYLHHMLTSLPGVNQDMFFMIRELQPTPTGLPVELYFFTSTVEWSHYESVQARVFDHVIAVTPQFGLRIFQQPSGHDISMLHLNISSK